jgi:hypothetical protein
MVMLITRINAIAKREGFLIEVFRKMKGGGQRHFLNSSNGHLGPYNFHRKLKDTKTVNDWKKERFEPSYLKQQLIRNILILKRYFVSVSVTMRVRMYDITMSVLVGVFVRVLVRMQMLVRVRASFLMVVIMFFVA